MIREYLKVNFNLFRSPQFIKKLHLLESGNAYLHFRSIKEKNAVAAQPCSNNIFKKNGLRKF